MPRATDMQQVAVVTGAASGIGRAVAERLVEDGYVVCGLDRTAADDPGGHGIAGVDVRDREAVEAFVGGVVDLHGRIDAVCNAAGVKLAGDSLTWDSEQWDETLAVNLTGVLHVVSAVLPTMIAQQSGVIVTIGSPSALADPSHLAYSASKAGVAALSTSLALAHLADHIRVNLVVPGSTRTGMNASRPERVTAELGRTNVAGRVNEPEDVAAAVSFLLSAAAETISGASIEVGTVASVVPAAILPGPASRSEDAS